jgi:bacillithiol synthase
VTANASSSSAGSLPDALRVDLAAAGLLPPLPGAFLAGRDLDLLAPLRFLEPSRLPAISGLAAGPPLARPENAAALRARAELAAALAVSNRSYGHQDTDRTCRLLADPATRVVVSGQQPGLFGGPLLTFAKLVAASRWAAALAAAGEPAVAVFWVATEDHDYAEVATTTVLTAEGPRSFDLGPDTQPLLPVGMRALSPAVTDVLRAMAAAVPGERYAEWLRMLARWYQPEARFGEAFCRAVAFMLGPHCPLLLDAMHPALKAAQRPWLARLVERRRELDEALARQDEAVTGRGYELRVSPQRGASPLFLLRRGERRRIEWRGAGGFALRGLEGGGGSARGGSAFAGGGGGAGAPEGAREADGPAPGGGSGEAGGVAELLRIVDENPAVVSPGVLARPAIADAVLGTTLQVLGPGELSYMPQAAAVYPLLEIEAPWVALRAQSLVLDAGKVRHLEEIGLPLAELLGGRSRLDRALAERAGGDFVKPVRDRLATALDELRAPALAADPNLERPLDKTREQVLRAIDLFAEKALPALGRRDEQQSRRIEALLQTCLPGGKPQERVVCAAHFQGKYGERLAASYWEQLDLDPARLAVVVP